MRGAPPVGWAHAVTSYAMVRSGGAWKPYPHMRALATRIQAGIARGGYFAAISMPPQHGKSTLVSHYLPAWFLEWFPSKRVALGSYEHGAAARWGRKVRDLFGDRVRPDVRAQHNWEIRPELGGGGMITAGVGGPLTSYGADLLVIDDPHKNLEEVLSEKKRTAVHDWWETVASARLAKGASVIVLHTRWHEDDLIGHLLSKWSHLGWDEIRLPALAETDDWLGRAPGDALCPELHPRDELERIRDGMSPTLWQALYQQSPIIKGGNIWKKEWFGQYRAMPSDIEMWLQSWDLKAKKETGTSMACGQVWGIKGRQRFLADEMRGKWGFLDSVAAMRTMSDRHPQSRDIVVVEDKALGPAVFETLEHEFHGLEACEPYGSKVARAIAVQGDIERHTRHPNEGVFLPADAPWREDWLKEVGLFPNGKYDDRVDTASQALLRARRAGEVFYVGVL